ncbi:MAG: PIN domain-containing protein [Bacteroidetes bacterium]|nr:PIN domain-containing protein [Bacteroidota bacterium]
MSNFAIDTNVLIYTHNQESERKQDIARNLIVQSPVISSQVVSEYINVMKRALKIPKQHIVDACLPNLKRCSICNVDEQALQYAKHLIQRYDFQIFDAIIIASAVQNDCQILYSEDMQHNMLIENQLRIINPFV